MISLSDKQLDTIAQVAAALPVEKRSDYLQRVAAALSVRHGFRFTDADASAAATAALAGLLQHSAA